MPDAKHWIPLESNPEVLNDFASKLGVREIPSKYSFCDVFGLDPSLLALVPSPVLAVLLLFPITPETEKLREEEETRMKQASVTVVAPNLFYMTQRIGNACGTIALIHSVANAAQSSALSFNESSFLQKFISDVKDLSPDERGRYLESPPIDAPTIDAIHEEAANQGATAAPPADEDVDLHFVAFVENEGRLWELDGRKFGPVDHGEIEDSLLSSTAHIVKTHFMERASSLNFSLIALAAHSPDED